MESTAQHPRLTSEPLGSANALLTPEELAALAAVAWGADVLDHGLAARLRALEAAHPDLVVCTEPKGTYPATARIPYLGASATTAGRELLAKHGYITSADVEHWTTADLITSSTRLGAEGAVPGDKEDGDDEEHGDDCFCDECCVNQLVGLATIGGDDPDGYLDAYGVDGLTEIGAYVRAGGAT